MLRVGLASGVSFGAERGLRVGVSGGSEPVLEITGGRITSYGDSFVNNAAAKSGNAITTYMSGVMVWAEAISLGAIQFDYDRNKGVNGEKASDVNARIASGAADLVSGTDVWFYSAGRNDVTQGIDAVTSTANIKAGCAALVALGKPVFLEIPNPPRSDASLSAGQRDVMNAVNTAIREWAATQVNVYLVDYFDDWDDGTGQPLTNYTYDGLHPSRIGAFVAAQRFWTDYGNLFPARQNTPVYTAYNSSTNPMGNLVSVKSVNAMNLAGTGGQKLNSQGSLATDWQCGRDSGTSATADVTLSKEAVDGTRFKQVYALNMTGTFTGNALSLSPFGSAPVTPAELLGKQVAAEFLVEITASSGMSLNAAVLNVRNNSVTVAATGLSNLDGLAANAWSVPPGTYLVRTPPVPVSAVDATPTFWPQLKLAVASGTTAGFKVERPTVNRIT